MKKERAFLKKSAAKNFCSLIPLAAPAPLRPGQKFFAELFFKKATAS